MTVSYQTKSANPSAGGQVFPFDQDPSAGGAAFPLSKLVWGTLNSAYTLVDNLVGSRLPVVEGPATNGFNAFASGTVSGVVTALQAAVSGETYVVYQIDASFSVAPINSTNPVIQLFDGATLKGFWTIGGTRDQRSIVFPKGIPMTKGNATSAVLSWTVSGEVGYLNLHGQGSL